jgi:choline dehydrogenase
MDQPENSISELVLENISCVSDRLFFLSSALLSSARFQQCAEAMGFPLVTDMNSAEAPCDGLGTVDTIIDQNKKRTSTFDAFLSREIALKREKRLKICTGVIVSKLAFLDENTSPLDPNGKSRRVEQVQFQYAKSKVNKVFSTKVNKEVIICSGAVGSPQVLMLR